MTQSYCNKAYYPTELAAEESRLGQERKFGKKLYVYQCRKHKRRRGAVFHLSKINPQEFNRKLNSKAAKRRAFHINAIATWESEGGAIR